MKLFISDKCTSVLTGKYIFLDNDFLSWLVRSDENIEEILTLLSHGYPMYEQFTKLEFLRDIYEPSLQAIYETFLNNSIFTPDIPRQESLNAILNNSLILSKIYKHKRSKANASVPDLLLAAKIMYNAQSSVLITGNKKDFPTCIFDTKEMITAEREDDSLVNFSVLIFNRTKFDECHNELKLYKEKHQNYS